MSEDCEDLRMLNWISWLTQHPAGRGALLLTLVLCLARLGRLLWCAWQLARLNSSLSRLATGQEKEVTQAFQAIPMEPLQVGWYSYQAGLFRGSSGALSLSSWTPRLWTGQLQGFAGLRWFAPLLLLASPWLACQAVLAGWNRFNREMIGLTSLQPWEGLRAVQIIRHATQSFYGWAEPGMSAALACLGCALVLFFVGALCEFVLVHLLHSTSAQLRRIFPPRSESSALQEMQEQLAQMHQLLVEIQQKLPSVS